MSQDQHASLGWRKSSYSNGQAECVEVTRTQRLGVAVRDSKDPHGPQFGFSPGQWRAFAAKVKAGFGAG
jgi:hypothetical protein